MIWVTKAKHDQDYKIDISFNDGKSGTIDLYKFIFQDKRPIFEALKDKDCFQNFSVDMDTIVWPNGADLAPEFLYELLETSTAAQKVSSKKSPSTSPIPAKKPNTNSAKK